MMFNQSSGFKAPDVNSELIAHTDTGDSRLSAQENDEKLKAVPRGWPTAPKTLAKGISQSVFDCCLDVLFAVLPVPFLVLGIIAAKYDRMPFENASYGHALLGAAKYGPTIFPIVFAALTGHFMERIASLRVEQGERIGILEQLLGSMTFFNTYVTHFQLRAFNILGIILMALWALSPIGGQASLRVVTVGSSTIEHTTSFQYMGNNKNWTLIGADAPELSLAVNSLFISSLASPRRNFSTDAWGNLKVPMLEALNSSQKSGNDEWFSVPANPTYAALIGLPMSSVSNELNSTLNLETFYWSLDCGVLGIYPRPFNFTLNDPSPRNLTGSGWHGQFPPGKDPQFQLSIDQEPASPTGPRRVLFESKGYNGTSHAECNITTSHVELRVSCVKQACRVTSIRKSTLLHPEPARTYFDEGPLFIYFSTAFVRAIPPGHVAVSTPIETYFLTPDSVFRSQGSWTDLYTVGPQSFATSLAQLMNTYWQAGIAPYNIAGGIKAEGVPTNETIGTTFESIQLLHCHRGWLAVLILSSLFLFFAGVVALVLGRLIAAPHIFTYVSSLTRDNPHVPLPPGGSRLSGRKRAILLKDIVIRLGDVRPEVEIGHIAIAAVNGERHVGRLQKQRLYS